MSEINSPAGEYNSSSFNFNDVSFGSTHPGGANFVFWRRFVRFLDEFDSGPPTQGHGQPWRR